MENLPTYRLTQSGPEAQEILNQVNLNTVDIEQLKRLYQALTQSEPEIIEPTDTWPVANPEENVIYRVIDRVNTPPQYYTDYMWNGTSMVPMAQYNNAIDNEPTANSNNLVKSGGVYSFVHANGGAYDISAAHAVGGVLATYDKLEDALGTDGANVPAAVRKGGMSIKFVNSSDNKYVRYNYLLSSTTNANIANVNNWQGVDEKVVVGSHNIAESEGVAEYVVENGNAFDISKYAATGGSLAKYDSLYAALNAVPSDLRKTGMVVKFIHTGADDYSYYKSISTDTWIRDEDDWEFCGKFQDAVFDVDNKFIATNGTLTSNDYWETTGFIPVKVIKLESLYLQNVLSVTAAIYFYDKSKNPISGVTTTGYISIDSYVIPENAYYVRFCRDKRNRATLHVQFDFDYDYINNLAIGLDENSVAITLSYYGSQIDFPVDNYYIKTDGKLAANNSWKTSNFFPVNVLDVLDLKLVNVNNITGAIYFYDENQNPISGITKNGQLVKSDYVVPVTAKYVRFCKEKNDAYYVKAAVNASGLYDYVVNDIVEPSIRSNQQSDNLYPYTQKTTNAVYLENGTTNTYQYWAKSEPIKLNSTKDIIFGELVGFNNGTIMIPNVVWLDASLNFIGCIPSVHNKHKINTDNGGSEAIPSNAAFYVIQVNTDSDISGKLYQVYYLPAFIKQVLPIIEEYNTSTVYNLLVPKKIYNVGNDIDRSISGFKRNFSSCLYIDNFLPNGLTKEPNVFFGDGKVLKAIPCYEPPMANTQGFSSYEKPKMNNEESYHSENVSVLVNNGKTEQTFTVVNRSVLNTASANKSVRILCIGDSVTFGQNAYFVGDQYKANYTLLLQEMFKKDNLQAGNGYAFETIGTISYNRTFSYNGNNYNIKGFNEGYSGSTMQGSGLFTNPKFLDTNNVFSFQNWLNKYRTKDNNGNQLYFDANGSTTGTGGSYGFYADGTQSSYKIGTEVTNVLDYNVCEPTHIFMFHGSNAAITKADYDEFISYVRDVFPDAVIGLGVPHVAGTYYPRFFPNYVNSERWNPMLSMTPYATNHYNTMVVLNGMEEDSSYEENNVFVLPTYFVNPSAKAISAMEVNEPCSDFGKNEPLYEPKGQSPNVHVGGIAHAAYAYQLYAWIKWTIVNDLF